MDNFKHHPIVVDIQNIYKVPPPPSPSSTFSHPPTPTVPAFSFPKPPSQILKLPTPFYPNQESSSDDNSDDEYISNQSTVHPFPTPPRETDEIVANDNVPEYQPPADEYPIDLTLPLRGDYEPLQNTIAHSALT